MNGGCVMKKILLSTVALAAMVGAPAMAADLAVKAPLYKAPPPVYIYSWTGCYVGGKGGGAWERDDYSWFVTAVPGIALTASETRGGWTVGVGGEYAFLDWLTGFVEYDYYDFGTRTVSHTGFGGLTANFDIQERKSVV